MMIIKIQILALCTSNIHCTIPQDWANGMLGPMAWTVPLSVAFSAFGSLNGSLFTAGRQVYAASKEGHLPGVISFVNIYRMTPVPALLFNVNISEKFVSWI